MLDQLLGHCNGFIDALRFEISATISYVCVPVQEGWIVKLRNMREEGGDKLGMGVHLAQLQPIMTVVRHTRRHSSYLLFCRLIPELRRHKEDA